MRKVDVIEGVDSHTQGDDRAKTYTLNNYFKRASTETRMLAMCSSSANLAAS